MTEKTIQYKRPTSLAEALALKQEFGDKAMFLLGGDFQPKLAENLEVLIDLQDAGLDVVGWNDNGLQVGGLATLNTLAESLELPDFDEALSIEYGLNVRNTLSLSNFFAQTNGRSPILCCLLALNAKVVLLNNHVEMPLASFLANKSWDDHVIEILVTHPVSLAFESVARTPKDLPILCVAAAKSGDRAIHFAVGGFGNAIFESVLEHFDDDGQEKIKDWLSTAQDEWASAEYRQEVGSVLLSRALQKLHLQTTRQEEK